MACQTCEVSTVLNGRPVHVLLQFSALERLAWSDGRNSFLYHCPACGAYWESCAYAPSSLELSVEEVHRQYPGVIRG